MPPKGSGKGKKSKKGSVTPPTQSTSSQPTVTPTKRPSPTVSVSGGSIAGSPKKARLEPNTFRPGTRRPAQDLNASRFGEVPAGVPVTAQEQLDYDHLTAPFNANYVFFWGEEGITPHAFKDVLTVEVPFQEAQVAFGLWSDRTMALSERTTKFVIEDEQVGEQTVSIFAKVQRGMRRSQMRDDVKMLNDVFNVFLSNVRGDVTLAYPNFCKAYPCRVYKASKYISRIEQKDNGGSMPRLGYEFRKKALPAGSALEDDEHSFEDLSYVEGAIKSRTYEKELAASTFNHVILFVSEDEQTGCNSFRSRHFRSIPDQVVLDLGLFDDDGLTVDQRLGRFEYVDRSMVLERRVMCSVFMKSPKVLTEDERVDDVEGLNRTLTRWAAEEDDAGRKKFPTVNELYGRFVNLYHSRVHPDYPIMSVNFELAMGGLAKCKTRVGHEWNRLTTAGPTVPANQSPVVAPNVQPTSSPKITSTVSFTGSNISPFSSPAAAAAGTPGPAPMAGISPLNPVTPANVPPPGSANVSPIPQAAGSPPPPAVSGTAGSQPPPAVSGTSGSPPPPAVSGTAVTPPPPGVSGTAVSPPPGSQPGTSRAGPFSHSTPVSPPRRVSGGSSGSTRSSTQSQSRTQSQGRSKSLRKRSRGHLKFRGASQAGMLGMPAILPQDKQRAQLEVRKRSHIRRGQEMALQTTQAAIDEAHTQGEVEAERALKELYDRQQNCMLQASPGQSSSSSGGDLEMLMPNFGKLMNDKVKKLYERQDKTMNPLFLIGNSEYRKKMKALENEDDLPDDATLDHEEVSRTVYRWIRKYGKEQMLITYSDNARLRRVCETLYEHELFMYETHWFLSSMKSNLNMTRFEHLSQDEEEEVRRYVPVQTREELLELAGNKRLMEMVARYCVNRLADVERNIGGVFFKCVMERWVMLSFKWKSDTVQEQMEARAIRASTLRTRSTIPQGDPAHTGDEYFFPASIQAMAVDVMRVRYRCYTKEALKTYEKKLNNYINNARKAWMSKGAYNLMLNLIGREEARKYDKVIWTSEIERSGAMAPLELQRVWGREKRHRVSFGETWYPGGPGFEDVTDEALMDGPDGYDTNCEELFFDYSPLMGKMTIYQEGNPPDKRDYESMRHNPLMKKRTRNVDLYYHRAARPNGRVYVSGSTASGSGLRATSSSRSHMTHTSFSSSNNASSSVATSDREEETDNRIESEYSSDESSDDDGATDPGAVQEVSSRYRETYDSDDLISESEVADARPKDFPEEVDEGTAEQKVDDGRVTTEQDEDVDVGVDPLVLEGDTSDLCFPNVGRE